MATARVGMRCRPHGTQTRQQRRLSTPAPCVMPEIVSLRFRPPTTQPPPIGRSTVNRLSLSATSSLLIFALAASGCSRGGTVRPSVCPTLPTPPPSLMVKPSYGQQVRQQLFQSPPNATPMSQDSKP